MSTNIIKQTDNIDNLEKGSEQCIGLKEKITLGRPLRIKLGIDPTAPHIHLGHSIVLRKLRQFQLAGHHIHMVIGDFTAKIGDPTGKDKTRPILDEKTIEENVASFMTAVKFFLDEENVVIHRNSEWLNTNSIEFVQILQHATVAQLLEREDFSNRMKNNKPLSLLEMVYPLMQGFDSVALEADVEIGGTDQLFNLMMGRSMQEKHGQAPQAVITMPILNGTDGVRKMSKTFDNHVSFTHSPEDVFGRTMSLPDGCMEQWFKLLFDKGVNQKDPREEKRLLARSVTELVHPNTAIKTQDHFDKIHQKGGIPDDIQEFILVEETVHIPQMLGDMFNISKSSARRLVKEGAIKIDGNKIDQLDMPKNVLQGKVLQKGRFFFKLV